MVRFRIFDSPRRPARDGRRGLVCRLVGCLGLVACHVVSAETSSGGSWFVFAFSQWIARERVAIEMGGRSRGPGEIIVGRRGGDPTNWVVRTGLVVADRPLMRLGAVLLIARGRPVFSLDGGGRARGSWAAGGPIPPPPFRLPFPVVTVSACVIVNRRAGDRAIARRLFVMSYLSRHEGPRS
jgi:hypothetical protein